MPSFLTDVGTIRGIGTEYSQKIPIIALTANAISGTENIFYQHGFQDFISKPIDIMSLDAVIRKWLGNESDEDLSLPEVSSVPNVAPDSEDEDTVIEILGIDTEKGLSFYGGDMDIYLPLLRSYVFGTPVTLSKLRSVSEETLQEYTINVHGLKGTSASIGAEKTREAALNLEQMARSGDLYGVLSKNDRFIKDTENIVANIQAWLEKYDSSSTKPRLQAPPREVLARLKESCENCDMEGIDNAMLELESADYEQESELVTWLKEKLNISEIDEVALRLLEYKEKS